MLFVIIGESNTIKIGINVGINVGIIHVCIINVDINVQGSMQYLRYPYFLYVSFVPAGIIILL